MTPIITGATADSVSMTDGCAPSGQALAVPATPASAVDGPAGFDPSRGFTDWEHEPDEFDRDVDEQLSARSPCSMDVGCDETGVCCAAAHSEPERCPRNPSRIAAVARSIQHYLDHRLEGFSNGNHYPPSSPANKTNGYIGAKVPDWQLRQWLAAIATEARRAETEDTGSVHEAAGPKDIAQ